MFWVGTIGTALIPSDVPRIISDTLTQYKNGHPILSNSALLFGAGKGAPISEEFVEMAAKRGNNERNEVASGNQLPVLVSPSARPPRRSPLKGLIDFLVILSFLLSGVAAALAIYNRITGAS